MKWYEDILAWLALSLVVIGIGVFSYWVGIKTVVDSCETYRAYKPSKEQMMLCMVVPISQQKGVGEKQQFENNTTFKRT